MKLFAAGLVAGGLTVGANAPAAAQHVAGGVIVEYNNLDVALVANRWSIVQLLRMRLQ